MALILLLLVSTLLLIGRTVNLASRFPLSGQFLGGCALAALCALMFFTVQYWVKWFFGVLGYIILRSFAAFLAGRTLSTPSQAFPRTLFLEMVLVSLAQATLCWKYLTRVPRHMEAVGLVAVVVSWSFGLVLNSNIPMWIGTGALCSAQLIDWRAQEVLERRKRKVALARRQPGQTAR
ncbi:MAG TPA: hypothetical protein VFQ41_08015 [Candidatus Angelobacter sp.]|nr:hypothetical protein [Candidatus Angelobacter sp.]